MRECLDEGILQSYFDGELSRKLAEGVSSHLASCTGCAQAADELQSESLLLAEALEPEFALSVPTERLRQRVDSAIAGMQVSPSRAIAPGIAGASGTSVVRRWLRSVGDLFTLSPQRAFGYAGLVAVILLAAIIAAVQFGHAPINNNLVTRAPSPAPTASPDDSGGTVATLSPSPTPSIERGPNPPVFNEPKKSTPRQASNQSKLARVKLLPGERSYLKTIASLDATIKAESNRQMKASLQVEYQRNLAMVDQAIAATRSAAKVNPTDPDTAEFMFAAYQSKIDLLSQVADSRLSNRQH